MSDLVQGAVVLLIGIAAAAFVLRQALRRFRPQAAKAAQANRSAARCGGCSGCSGGGCGPARR